jgi:DNA-binding NarL/FixJ family response regulator
MTRILIADSSEVVRSGLRHILEGQAGWEVVAEAGDGKDMIFKALASKPDVIVVECPLPEMTSIEVTRHVRRRLPRTEVLIFASHHDEALAFDLLKAGARGYMLRSESNANLLEAVSSLAAHRPFFTCGIADRLLQSFVTSHHRPRESLTHRERGVVQLIAEGHTNKEVASILDISLKTVETHRASVMRKLKLSSSAALVRYAVRTTIVEA